MLKTGIDTVGNKNPFAASGGGGTGDMTKAVYDPANKASQVTVESDIINNVISFDTDKPLSAYQGKLLNDDINTKVDQFRTDIIYPAVKNYNGSVITAGNEAALIAAIASAINFDIIQITANITLTATLIINKSIKLTGGFILQSAGGAGDPVTLISVTANDVYIDNTITLKHLKTTNTGSESAISLNANNFISEAAVEFMEFAYFLKGSWSISGSTTYTGALANNHRHFGIYQIDNPSLIKNVIFDFPDEATPRDSFVYLSSNIASDKFNSVLKIANCLQSDMTKIARQFYLQDAFVSDLSNGLIIENCRFNELNGDIGVLGASGQNVLTFFGFVAILNNYSGNAAVNAEIYKGLFYMDGSGVIHNYGVTNYYYSGNLHAFDLRNDYNSAYDNGGICYKNTVYDNTVPVNIIKNIQDDSAYNWIAKITADLANIDRSIKTSTEKIQTVDATQTIINTIPLLDENTYHFEIIIIGVQNGGTNRASYKINGTFYRTAAGNAILSGSATVLHQEESNPSWATGFLTSGNNVQIYVTGIAATTINWKCVTKYVNLSD